MRVWQELRPFALVMLLIAAVCASAITSCGGGGGGSNGELCQQCGDTDGQCQDTVAVTGNERPSFCGTNDPCTVELRCLRKLDSAQRRCFPADPATNALDILYRCDGARPNPSIAPTITPIPNPTLTASATPTPTSTGPTATGSTATPTSSAATSTESAPTPTPTATPGEVTVDITIDNPDDVSASSVTATVKYPSSKGSFLKDNATDCPSLDDGLTAHDDGGGTLMLRFPGNPTDAFPINASCTFHQIAGQTLVGTELTPSVDPTQLTIEIGSLS
jgi:hypothetical protein